MPNNSKIQGSKVLVTGGAGFIGSNLIEAMLKQENYIVCLDNFITGKKHNIEPFFQFKNFKFIQGDIRNLDDCRKAVKDSEIVLHQAALGSVPRSINDPNTTNNINANGFLNMLIAARDEGIKRFVYATSSSVYGDIPELPKVEERTGHPLSPYAITKVVNEMYAKVFSDLFNIKLIGLRYFNVFGKRQDPEGAYAAVIPKFIKQLIKGESPVIYGDGSQSRDFTFVANVIHANQLAATTENPEAINNVFNIANGEKTNLNELFNILKELLSKFDKNILKITPQFNSSRKGDIQQSYASIDKAKKFLGYRPLYNLKAGLELTIKWYYESLKNY
ncbi:MAG: SDR family oxidoreductase [Bacteroidia bacterium]|nr:SDR family oxidoreductase [Bacteroidia bacterium]